jgi:L-asparaginase / beta-aspartyl-peptidase
LPAPLIVVHGGAGAWHEGTEGGSAACVEAVQAGAAVLERRGSALDAVAAAVRVLEDAPACNAATGAALTRAGTLELDACLMDGATLRSGAVACLPAFRHPIDVARAVLDDGRYHLLAADGAASFALAHGFSRADPQDMILAERRAEIERLCTDADGAQRAGNTVGAVALDVDDRLAAATSTGGVAGTVPGRVGDSPIAGAGTYANDIAACSCTGDGESFARACAAFWAVERAAEDPQSATVHALERVQQRFAGVGGMILLNRLGQVGVARTMALMPHAIARAGEPVLAGV